MDIQKTSELEPVPFTASLASPENAGDPAETVSSPPEPLQPVQSPGGHTLTPETVKLEEPKRKRDDYSVRREVPSVAHERAESPGGHTETSEAPSPEAALSTATLSELPTSTVEAEALEVAKAAEAYCAAQPESPTAMDPITAPSLDPKDGKPPGAAVEPVFYPDDDYYDSDEAEAPAGKPTGVGYGAGRNRNRKFKKPKMSSVI